MKSKFNSKFFRNSKIVHLGYKSSQQKCVSRIPDIGKGVGILMSDIPDNSNHETKRF